MDCDVDALLTELPEGFDTASANDFSNHAGAKPWLVANKIYASRFGPAAMPMPGFGFLATIADEVGTTDIISLPVSIVLDQGIALSDTLAFLDTPKGEQCFADHASIITLSAGKVVWVPYGHVAWPAVWRPVGGSKEGEEEPVVKAGNDADFSMFWHQCVFSPRLSKKLPGPVWNAIHTLNKDHLDKNQAARAWAPRAELFSLFSESLAK